MRFLSLLVGIHLHSWITRNKWQSGVMLLDWVRMQLATPLTNPSPNSAPQNLRGIERVWLMIRENHYQPLSTMSIAYRWSSTPSQAVIHAHGVPMGAACTNCGQLQNTTDPRESNQIIWHNACLAQVLIYVSRRTEHNSRAGILQSPSPPPFTCDQLVASIHMRPA